MLKFPQNRNIRKPGNSMLSDLYKKFQTVHIHWMSSSSQLSLHAKCQPENNQTFWNILRASQKCSKWMYIPRVFFIIIIVDKGCSLKTKVSEESCLFPQFQKEPTLFPAILVTYTSSSSAGYQGLWAVKGPEFPSSPRAKQDFQTCGNIFHSENISVLGIFQDLKTKILKRFTSTKHWGSTLCSQF